MSTKTLSFAAFVLLITIGTAAHAEETKPTVFRNLAWGDPVETLGSYYKITMTDPEPGFDYYRKRDENLSLGALGLRAIDYHFFQNRLTRIVLWTAGKAGDAHDMAERILEARYGPPTSKALLSNNRGWKLGETEVWLMWPLFGSVHIKFESTAIADEYEVWLEAYKNEQAAKSADDW